MTDLDRLLRDDARVPLPDDGFSTRVMDALPARAARTRPWFHSALILGSATLGCILAVVLAPAGASIFQGFADVAQLRFVTPAAITAIALAVTLLLSALILAAEAE